jgi:hypothetical protein
MKKQPPITPDQIKPDLKHDTMEYAASTDGDDVLDSDDPYREEDEISSEELDFIEEDDLDAQAEALNSVEEDRQADNDVIFDEKDIDD